MELTLSEELDLFISNIESIPAEKKYWLIRTQGGDFYNAFRENSIVALEHSEITLSYLNKIQKEFGKDSSKLLEAIKIKVHEVHKKINEIHPEVELDPRRIGLIASQVYKFVFEIKKGDIIIIPSAGSDIVSFGIAQENFLGSFQPEEERKIGVDTILKRRITWIEDIKRKNLDPYLYRIFTAHQALNDVGTYADVIERSLKDFFILDNEAHLIINVQTEQEIPAKDLFGMGSEILRLIDEFAEQYQLDIRSTDLQVTVNLNSPGKIDLKSKIKKTTVVAGILLAAFGGGYQSKDGTTIKTPGIPGIIDAIDKFKIHQQERSMKEEIFEKYKDSLNVKNPDDMIKLLKQFSENKDIAK